MMHLLQLLHLDSVNDVDFIPPTVALPHMHAGVSLLWSDRQAKGWGKDGECDEGESSKLANETSMIKAKKHQHAYEAALPLAG